MYDFPPHSWGVFAIPMLVLAPLCSIRRSSRRLWSLRGELLSLLPLRGVLQVFDIVALRVIVSDNGGTDTLPAIRAAYGVPPIAHRIWRSVPSEYDDYILAPKKSGYQSIHLAAIDPEGVPLEVQVSSPPSACGSHRGVHSQVCTDFCALSVHNDARSYR